MSTPAIAHQFDGWGGMSLYKADLLAGKLTRDTGHDWQSYQASADRKWYVSDGTTILHSITEYRAWLKQ